MAGTTVLAPASVGERLKRILSYTERTALALVLEALGDSDQGAVVAGDIADAHGIARTSVMSALRLAEAAGVLVTRSMGQKGTMVWLYDRQAIEEAVRA